MKLFNLILWASEGGNNDGGCGTSSIVLYVVLGLLIVAMLIVPTFSNKKRSKQINELHNSVEVGDTIKTIGGIVGKVIAVNQISPVEKEMVIETGIEGKTTTLVLDMQALYQNLTKIAQASLAAQPEAEKEAPAEENIVEDAAKADEAQDEDK